jgi:predicted ATPase/class 3 adenylate cyclase
VKNLLPHFIQEQYRQGRSQGQLQAYTMFIDMSGFTPLTEALMHRGSRGAEELSVILNDVFAPLVNLVYAKGGFIPYFAGDAFTAIFPARQTALTPVEFLQAALQVRNYFSRREFQFNNFTIGLKIGLSWGRVEWGIVGEQHKSYYFRGAPIESCAQCQTRANNQEIILDESLRQLLEHSPFELAPVEPNFYQLVYNQALEDWKVRKVELPESDIDIEQEFFPETVLHFSGDGEFRPVISIFISFTGVASHELLDAFANIVLEKINNYSGYFKEIDFGDKGGVITCFFGAPVAFENGVERALEFICSVKGETTPLQEAQGLQMRAGMTIGTAYTGFVGGMERCQYAVVGNRVNLAARIMTFADWGEILVDAEIRKNRRFTFDHKGDIKYKGIRGNVPTFKLEGRNENEDRSGFAGQMVGRDPELQRLLEFAHPLLEKRPAGIAAIFGEAGIGKSRLTHELKQKLSRAGKIEWLLCQTDQILRKPFNPFLYLLRNYFEQSVDGATITSQEKFERWFEQLLAELKNVDGYQEVEFIEKELVRVKTVLAALIGINYPNSIWEQLDARGRYQNTIQAILTLIIAESLVQPVVLQLEDAHWMDDNSRELVQELTKYLVRYPILLLITSRLRDDGLKPVILEEEWLTNLDIPRLEINLSLLAPESVRHFAEAYLQGPISEEFFELLLRTTNSNPFYVEQVLEYFSESSLVEFSDNEWNIKDKNIQLSGSINAILTARIDRLSSLVKETVKAAAVIGREFELPVLTEVMKGQEEFLRHNGNAGNLLREQIQLAERGQIWHAMNELRYIFRHSLLREAAYSMQLRTRLQQLHQLIAEAIERLYADRLDERYSDLAFHYEQADVPVKTIEYLRKAADYARRNYQNQLALDYYEKLLKHLTNNDDLERQVRTYLQKGKVLELIGKWDECEQTYTKALRQAKKTRDVLLLGQCNNSLGRLLVLKGNYENAAKYLQTAVNLFELLDDKSGTARVYGNLGNLHMRQGKYKEAKSYFTQSIELSRSINEIPNSQIVGNLGITYMNQGKYDDAIRCQQEQLLLAEHANDKQGMADLYTKLGIVYFDKGDYDAALENYRRGLQLSEELGNKQLTAIATGCIGTVFERKGDYERAMAHFERDLQLCEELGDKQGIAIALGLIGELLSYKGEFYKAIEYLQKNLMISESLGYQKGIAKAVNTLADVFFFLKEYSRSLQYYNRAIEVTRTIGNKSVLGFSLTEKGAVLVETGALSELSSIVQEALDVALELGNPDLLFEAQILSAKSFRLYGNNAQAQTTLKGLLSKPLQKSQQAAVYAELYRLLPHEKSYRDKALKLYQELYAATPKFVFKKQMDMLAQV